MYIQQKVAIKIIRMYVAIQKLWQDVADDGAMGQCLVICKVQIPIDHFSLVQDLSIKYCSIFIKS